MDEQYSRIIAPDSVPSAFRATCDGFEVTGTIVIPQGQRASDFINNQRHSFVLSNAEVTGAPALGSTFQELILIRDQILFFHLPEPVASASSHRGDYTEKVKHRVRCIIANWVVEGDLHLADLADMHAFFNVARSAFIPLTDAVLEGPPGHRQASTLLVSQQQMSAVAAVSALG